MFQFLSVHLSVSALSCEGVSYAQPQQVVIAQPAYVVPAYGESPVATTCPNCHLSVVTAVSFAVGGLAWVIFGILCILGYVI
jgi:LITAF-like zinc ribbon domain